MHMYRGQFHQHFRSSFYARRSQKRKKDSQLKLLFALLGSASVKAARKLVDEIDPWSQQTNYSINCDHINRVFLSTVQSPKLKKLFFSAGTESHYRTFSSNPMQSESPSREVKIGDRVELRCTFKVPVPNVLCSHSSEYGCHFVF